MADRPSPSRDAQPAAGRAEVIDCHVHVLPWAVLSAGAKALLEKGRGSEGLARLREIAHEPRLLVEMMDAAGISHVGLIGYVSPDVMGYPREINEWIAGYVAQAPDRLFGYGSVHPRFTADAAADMDHVLGELGLAAIKVHPSHQLYAPNAYLEGLRALATVYEKASEYGVPVAVHTGTSTFPQARNRLADPLLVEDVAIDFPDLRIVLAHGGRPFWTEQAFFLVRRFEHVHLDISGIPPRNLLSRYFPRLEAIADKVLYGSDWAGPGVPDFRQLADECRALPIERGRLGAILAENARRLFGLRAEGGSRPPAFA
ncbi:MAG TPA: amidohydrolase family protein [Gemmatimonadota bacterium]|jgi:predicted TIM-barrel fold metal-dependent hydrolase